MRKLTALVMSALLVAASFSSASTASQEGWSYCSETMRLKIADASTWVSIAKVNLKITELHLEEGRLTGSYDMKVPMFSDNNEVGRLDLTFAKQISELRQDGGMMKGIGVKADEADECREVSCEIFPSAKNKDKGRIVLIIDTGDRILKFKSTYAVEKIAETQSS
ncbi:hypothetical protein [Rubellicoccus peritrichatus]|uniref:Lipid/polyisoprenoid-binding YceI-like domain-containing protein n=1 Tax=Rubellicoccus peritrichatus TaxID=3080537 RepID=A0AAQ3L8W3_9BACT|nr:hypothetical protein [Puniceicoccus sp. CR14]WOO40991.1 hypothetical protein RZN69_20420 [Puniceicoccus sp. CR14]